MEIEVNLKNVELNSVISRDVYNASGVLIITKNSKINHDLLQKLKKWNINSVFISSDTSESITASLEIDRHFWNKPKNLKYRFNRDKRGKLELLFQSLIESFKESKYGQIHLEEKMLDIIAETFLELTEEEALYKRLLELKNHNQAAFIHAMEVFVFGVIIAEYQKFQYKTSFAKACLLYNNGFVDISKDILVKKSELTYDELCCLKTCTGSGISWVIKNLMHDQITINLLINHSKQHHLYFTNTPNSLEIYDSEIEEYNDWLSVVIYYSKITSCRSFYGAKTANEVLSNMLEFEEMFRQDVVAKFINILGIYPENSIVTLSDGQLAKVIHVNKSIPSLPTVLNMKTEELVNLPTDRSLTIKQFLRYLSLRTYS